MYTYKDKVAEKNVNEYSKCLTLLSPTELLACMFLFLVFLNHRNSKVRHGMIVVEKFNMKTATRMFILLCFFTTMNLNFLSLFKRNTFRSTWVQNFFHAVALMLKCSCTWLIISSISIVFCHFEHQSSIGIKRMWYFFKNKKKIEKGHKDS